jgi:hypothetical protein
MVNDQQLKTVIVTLMVNDQQSKTVIFTLMVNDQQSKTEMVTLLDNDQKNKYKNTLVNFQCRLTRQASHVEQELLTLWVQYLVLMLLDFWFSV